MVEIRKENWAGAGGGGERWCWHNRKWEKGVNELQRRSDLCIPRNETARPRSQFPHSCICERFIYSQDVGKSHECRNWERGRTVSFLEIFVSKFRYSVFAVRNEQVALEPKTNREWHYCQCGSSQFSWLKYTKFRQRVRQDLRSYMYFTFGSYSMIHSSHQGKREL
jgi:hypothetical protein